ncbi:TRAP transporter small permease [Alteribacillus sp. HJP-4]|uniref:TRAP transporter small permease n=1 Tax=Alteribacillus sp. HJP-4 TaxID=2775394 RepID=UPI0035CD2FF4
MGKVNKVLNNLEEYFGFFTLMLATLLIFVQVVMRYVFNESIMWSAELARYLIIWFIFIGSSIAVRERAHAKVDVLITYVPTFYKKLLEIAASFTAIIFCGFIFISGIQTIDNVTQFANYTPALRLPMFIPYLAIPVGAVLMGLRFFQLIWEDLQILREEKVKKQST